MPPRGRRGGGADGRASQEGHTRFELYQNQPNPFADETLIDFYLPEAGQAVLKVFDVNGVLLHREATFFDKGRQGFTLSGGQLRAAGLLYYRVETARGSATRKMVKVE